jgi:glycosyltransferase involved in cell wall biosynthesis
MRNADSRGTVVHFVTNVGGGVWSVVKTLAAFHRPRWRTMLVGVYRDSLGPGIAADAERLFDRCVFVRRPPIPGIFYLSPLSVASALRSLQIENEAAPVVHHFHAGPYTSSVYRLPRQPQPGRWLATFHGSPHNFGDTDGTLKSRLKRRLHRAGVAAMQRNGFTLVSVSNRAARDCAEMYHCRESDFRVIYNGTMPDATGSAATRDRGRPLRVGFVGTVMPAKGWRLVVDAVAQLRRNGATIVCSIVGDGPEFPQLRRLAAEHSDWLSAPGHIQRPERDVFPSLDVLLLPSQYEGHPCVLLEAMACGVPCICSDVGGCSETVRDGQDGFLLRQNTSGEIADCLRRIDAEDGPWTRMSRSSVARHSEMFTAGRMAASWEQLYLEGN